MTNLKKELIEACYKYKDCHLASSLSALPIIEGIYKEFDFDNDVFILSKGHACKALFVVLKDKGFKPNFKEQHPDIDIKNGVACTTGSLGHGLPIAVGMALAKTLKGEEGIVHVLLGDGECQEGTTWESLLVGNKFRLKNLAVHIDNNKNQALGKTLYPAVHMLRKLFGINVHTGEKLYPHVMHITKDMYEGLMK